MRSIAPDELRHAALAWDLHDWLCARLSSVERQQVRAAMTQAANRLRANPGVPESPELAASLGLPDPASCRIMIDALCRRLWSPSATRRDDHPCVA